MIINTGGQTDTVQYYTEWLLNRFSQGYALSRNPLFPNKVTRYELTPDTVDCVVFCSKNYKPILPRLHEITDRFNTYFHYTITAYGKEIAPGVPGIEESMETLIRLSEIVGKQRIAWRYDPVLLTKEYVTYFAVCDSRGSRQMYVQARPLGSLLADFTLFPYSVLATSHKI